MVAYWPHAGIGTAVVMNTVALTMRHPEGLIATASNLLAFCAFRLTQRHKR